eukprot:symbB.v1.2.031362.t1/scaffold3633.1/size69136/2
MQKHFERPGLTWQTMDATSMTFEDDRFDLAVDKGTLDAMMSAGDQEHTLAGALLSETWRVLKPSGLLILVSHSGKRMKLLRSHGHWRCIELRRCRLSPQATFINMLRSKLPLGAPLKDAFQQPQLLQEASQEAKDALRRMAFIDAFRIFKARKKAQMGEDRMEAEEDLADAAEQNEENVPSDPRRQPFCWVYVLRKMQPDGEFPLAVAEEESTDDARPPPPEIKEAPFAQLFDGSLARRSAICRQLSRLWSSPRGNGRGSGSASAFEKEASKALLMQLLAPQLRLMALKALQEMPCWDPEVLNRAVRIPPFQKEDDGYPEGTNAKTHRPLEPWYGALFFVLDDEDQRTRAAALQVLVAALCSRKCLFQRLAQIASLCLHDTSEMVRSEATAALVEVMTSRNVSLTATASLKDGPTLETVLHAFPRDPRAVLEVLKSSRFNDMETCQQALEWMLTVQPLQEQDLRAIAWRLSGEIRKIEEQPPPKKRKGSVRDSSLPSATRVLTAALLHGSPMDSAQLADALARGVRMERLKTLAQCLSSRCAEADALPNPTSRSPEAGDELRQQCVDQLSSYWQQCRQLLQVEISGPTDHLKTSNNSEMLKKLSDLQQRFATRSAANDEEVGSLSLPLAWAELMKSFIEASLERSGSGKGQAAAVKFHQAVSMVIYGFQWPQLPRDLMAFRWWSLHFLGVQVELSQEENQLKTSLLDVHAPCPFPSLAARSEAHRNDLSFPERHRWRVESGNHSPVGLVMVDVSSSISIGLRLKIGDGPQSFTMIEVPPLGNARRPRRVFFPSSSRASSLQLFLAVDAAGGKEVKVKDPEIYRLVNFIPLGKLEKLPRR